MAWYPVGQPINMTPLLAEDERIDQEIELLESHGIDLEILDEDEDEPYSVEQLQELGQRLLALGGEHWFSNVEQYLEVGERDEGMWYRAWCRCGHIAPWTRSRAHANHKIIRHVMDVAAATTLPGKEGT